MRNFLAFYSIISESDGRYIAYSGSLFNPPPELRDQYRVEQYLRNAKEGWSVSELGYLCFRKTDESGKSYLFPGLYLDDGPKPKKKFYGYRAQFTKKSIETYVWGHIGGIAELKEQAEQEMTTLVHDLRHLSTAIYHSAEQADRALKNNDFRELSEGLKTIVATQTMLKARIDYLDYVSGVDRFETLEKIPVYSRVDKVVRCFQAAAHNNKVELKLSGESFRLSRGPNILDIVPYTLIDNAIKYSPKNHEVQVKVCDLSEKTMVRILSVGPVLEDHEIKHIFDRGFRGKNALVARPAGTGLGLAVAKDIIDRFSGEISASTRGEVRVIDGVGYHQVEFQFAVPSSGDDEFRRKRSGRWQSLRRQ